MSTQVLIVDDSPSVLDVLKHLIEADGVVKVTTFLDPVTALGVARERHFDIVLVDYEMPKMNGIDFIRELRLPDRFYLSLRRDHLPKAQR